MLVKLGKSEPPNQQNVDYGAVKVMCAKPNAHGKQVCFNDQEQTEKGDPQRLVKLYSKNGTVEDF